jgi:hypothetical protein
MDIVRRLFEATAALVDSEAGAEAEDPATKSDAKFEAIREALLDRAGGALSLTKGAKLLASLGKPCISRSPLGARSG